MNQNNCFRVTRIAIHLLLKQKKFNYGKTLFFSDQLEILILTEFSEKPSFQKNCFAFFVCFSENWCLFASKFFSSYGSKLLFSFRFKKIELPTNLKHVLTLDRVFLITEFVLWIQNFDLKLSL